QKFDSELRNYFKKIIKNYNKNSNYLIGIPYYINQSNEELKKDPIKFSIWLHLKVEFVRSFQAKEKYFDAHFFYQKEYCIPFIEQNLLNNSVIIVSNKSTKEKIINSQIYQKNNFKSLDFIETPSENSFSEYQNIVSKIENMLSSNEFQQYSKKEIKIIFSTGPTSKVLVYYFSQKGYISFDIGYGIRYLWDQKDVSYKI
ncbi:MAG: GT-D fold domain-containing glycosyltransferase, partial [Flavobacterium sp.]